MIFLSAILLAPATASLTPARDLTGTWKSVLPEKYYEMDPSDPTMRMNDVNVSYTMKITQSGSSINIVMDISMSSWITDTAYWNEYEMSGVPSVGWNQIGFAGTVSGATFSANELFASSGNAEHIDGTFTTDIITATLTGKQETTEVNGIIVLRSGSTAALPHIVTSSPTPTPTPSPSLPTAEHLARISTVQGNTYLAATGMPVTTQSPIGTGSEVQTGNDGLIVFSYPDNGGELYLGPNSDAAWIHLEPQTDLVNGNISYVAVPPPTGSYSFSEGIEPDKVGQVGVSLAAEVGVGLAIMAATGAPITLGGAIVIEGTLLLESGIAYITEQMSPQEGTYNVRPIVVPQGLVLGEGTQYIVKVIKESTTIQVLYGKAIFIDQYSNNSIPILANQMLTLPADTNIQELPSEISSFDSSTINQWWIASLATPIIAPTTKSTQATEATTNSNPNLQLQPTFLAGIALVSVFILIAIVLTMTKKNKRKQAALKP